MREQELPIVSLARHVNTKLEISSCVGLSEGGVLCHSIYMWLYIMERCFCCFGDCGDIEARLLLLFFIFHFSFF